MQLLIREKIPKIFQELQNTMLKRIFCTTSKDSTQDQFPNVPALVNQNELEANHTTIMNLYARLEQKDLHIQKLFQLIEQ